MMDILYRKFQDTAFRDFEQKLNEIESLDKEIAEELGEMEEESIIVEHRGIFFNRRRIIPEKIDSEKVHILASKLLEATHLAPELRRKFTLLKKSFNTPDAYEKKLIAYLERELGLLFTYLSAAYDKSLEIEEFLTEFRPTELLDDFERLDSALDHIRRLIRQIKHYSDFWHARSQKHYIDARVVIKTNEYKSHLEKYLSSKKNILDIENKIETYPSYQKKLHERINHGLLKGMLHARVTGNLRIFYRWDPLKKILSYEKILTKNEFDKL